MQLWIARYEQALAAQRKAEEHAGSMAAAFTMALEMLTVEQLAELERRIDERNAKKA